MHYALSEICWKVKTIMYKIFVLLCKNVFEKINNPALQDSANSSVFSHSINKEIFCTWESTGLRVGRDSIHLNDPKG